MAEEIAVDEELDEEEGLTQLVSFDIGNERFGVNILAVREIIRSAPVTAVPNSPEFIEGVINLRGEIIPVLDLRKRLNLYQQGSRQKKNWILILNVSDRVIGFIVDRVNEVIKVADESIELPPDIIIAGLENQYIQGVCDIDGGMLIILQFERVLFNEEYFALKEVGYDEVRLDEEAMI